MKTKTVLFFLLSTILYSCNRPIFVGHRGSLLGVENTAEAFINGAVHYGYQGLECDVKVTKDSQLVCWHDNDLRRGGIDSIEIPTSTLKQLQALTLKQTRKGVEYSAEICTVDEYLSICKEHDVFPVVELKWGIGLNNNDMTLFPKLYAMLEKYDLIEDAIILTSMQQSIEYIRKNYPALTCQWLRWQVEENDYVWCQEWNVSLSVPHKSVTEDIVKRSKQINKTVATWTVNEADDYERVKKIGCKYITTDYLEINH